MAPLRTRPTTFIVPCSPKEQLLPNQEGQKNNWGTKKRKSRFFLFSRPSLARFQFQYQVVGLLRPFPPMERAASLVLLLRSGYMVGLRPPDVFGIHWGDLVVPTGWRQWGRSMGLDFFFLHCAQRVEER